MRESQFGFHSIPVRMICIFWCIPICPKYVCCLLYTSHTLPISLRWLHLTVCRHGCITTRCFTVLWRIRGIPTGSGCSIRYRWSWFSGIWEGRRDRPGVCLLASPYGWKRGRMHELTRIYVQPHTYVRMRRCIRSVSYTHLDVYKRQFWYCELMLS